MSWDQPAFSFGTPNAQPPTPTKTPTFAHIPSPAFQTPGNNRSSFEDRSGWTPTFAEEYSVFNSTPGRLTSSSFADTTPRPPQALDINRGSSNAKDIAAELATHVHHFSPNPSLPLPPVDPSNLLPSSPGPYDTRFDDPKKKVTPRRPKKHLEDPFTGQTATPPNTASRGTRKLAPKLSTETMQTDQDGHYGSSQMPPHGANMMDFPTTAADFFNYPLSAPATAPVFTNTKPFWDPDQSMDGMDIDFNTDDNNLFNTGSHRIANSFDWGRSNQMFQEGVNDMEKSAGIQDEQQQQPQLKMKRQRPLAPKVDLSELLKNTPALPEFQFHDPSVPRVQNVQRFEQAVDPANLWSRANVSMSMAPSQENISLPQSRPSTSHADMQPYSQQVRESLRDQEEYIQDKMRSRRKVERATASSPVRSSRPGPQRSMSESRGRRSQDRTVSRSGGGRASPLKRMAGLSSIPETAPRLRTEVEFVIDSNGRARMENVVVRDHSANRYEDGDSPYESSSDDEAPIIQSRNTSFEIPQQKAPRVGSFDTLGRGVERRERRHSTHNSYSRSESSRSSQRSTRRGSIDSEAETVMEHDTTGDATQEIRKMMETRKQNHYKAQNAMPRRNPTDLRPRPRYANYASSSNVSPSNNTDTPSSTRSGTTRCVCNNPDSEGFMIQCESCDNWLHTECIGIDQNSLPPVYICAFCAQTPIKRGPRLRDTARVNNHVPGSSPLFHKSFQSFR